MAMNTEKSFKQTAMITTLCRIGETGFSFKKGVDEIAKEVIRGDWGNGDERKKRLTEAGYYYDKVQKSERVNLLVASRSMLNIGYGAIFKY